MIISSVRNIEDVKLRLALRHVQKDLYIGAGTNNPSIGSVTKAFYEHNIGNCRLDPTLNIQRT